MAVGQQWNSIVKCNNSLDTKRLFCITAQNELHLNHQLIVNAGHLKDVKAIFGFHVWPASPSGSILTKAGTAFYPFCSLRP